MDFDYSDYEYSEAFEEQMEEYPTHSLADEDDLSHDISFKGHIDDICTILILVDCFGCYP